ncbi:MAG: hypothetical protein HY974_00885 [Candidatus Kerfeldbacteria bacterium]|nr:hypothetical protein [Candidatus Kerfeldbacteria bacterium]
MALKMLTTLVVLLASLNAWGWQNDLAGLTLGLIYLALTLYLLGGRAGGFLATGVWGRYVWGLIITLGAVSIIVTGLFYLNFYSLASLAGVLIILPWFGSHKVTIQTPAETEAGGLENLWLRMSLGLTYLVLAALTLYLLSQAQTVEAIRTPWQVVPGLVFLLYGLTCACYLTLSLFGARHPAWPVPLYLLTFSLAGLVYPLGFGFDPLIHQASEKLLLASGTISPKPLYYVGQYSLVTTIAWLGRLSVAMVDTWLAPLLASLVLPTALWAITRRLKLARPWPLWLIALPLALTLPAFTYTTPQGLANLWALTTIILLATRFLGASLPVWLPWLGTLAALVAHPLTGLPMLGVTMLWWLIKERPGVLGLRHQLITRLVALATALAVPAAFMAMSWFKPGGPNLTWTHDFMGALGRLGQDMLAALPFLPRLIDLSDAVYLWGRPLTLILLILATVGWWRSKRHHPGLRFMALAFALSASSYLMLRLGASFPNLEPNEQGFYSLRLWELALLCLLPLAMVGAYELAQLIKTKLNSPLLWVAFGSLILTAGFYLTYPRVDIWHKNAAYNTTPADIEAVQLINKTAGEVPYVVLSNQAVAAAAVHEYGFSQYYQGHFYYPLPTGANPLYQVYLAVAEQGLPTREAVARAAQISDVPQVYLALNRYWANFDQLTATARKQADESWTVASGRLQVFRYDF